LFLPTPDKGLTAIKTQSLVAGGSGGNVTLIAFWGNNGAKDVNGLLPGTINAPNTVITTSGNGAGTSGNVLTVGGGGQPPQVASNQDLITIAPPNIPAVTLGTINAPGGAAAGSITIAAAEPTIQGVDGVIDVIDGTVQPGVTVLVNGVPHTFN